ncbi:24120_t:CDS:2 [Entrophospora sp. SA101]|nr:24120_t:CDS:2 [Entrophospora sp. SA101]
MYKLPHNTVDSAFKPFAPLISTSNAMINQIINIFENAEYNKKICNVFLDRVDVAKIHIKNLERRKEENEYLFRDVDYYKHFVRFTTILTEIKTFLNDITNFLGYNKHMENLKFKMTIAPEEQKKKDQQNFKEDHEDMKKFWRSIGGGIVDDNQQMNTSLRLAITIKARVESIDNQDDSIKAIQIPPNMLQDPKYKKSSDFRGERPYYIRKEILKGDIEVACRDIIIHDLSANEYQKIQKQLFILEKLRDSKNILRFYGLSTVDDVSTLGFERIPYDKWDIPKIREYVLSSKRELVTYDDDDEKMLKLQEEYSNIFIGAWRDDPTTRSSLQHIFLKLDNLASKYGKSNENIPFPKKRRNPDGTIARSKHSVSVSDDKGFLEANKPDSIMPIISLEEVTLPPSHNNPLLKISVLFDNYE